MDVYTESHVIAFTRDMDRALQVKSYRRSVDLLIDSIATKSMTNRGWSFDEDIAGYTELERDDDGKRYRWVMHVDFAHAINKPGKTEFASILYTLYSRAMTPAFGRWELTHVDGNEYQPPADDDTISSKIEKENIGYADVDIPADWTAHFEHLYGLDAHVARVRAAIQAAIASNFRNRFNTVLFGEPGCGKSDILTSMREALGEDAVKVFDATATTAAGMIKELDELPILPRIVVFEEIEKATESSMQPLLSILDTRGEVRKTTARGKIEKETKVLAFATVNDVALFNRMQAGALASRFSNKVFVPRQGREITLQILKREIAKIDGDPEWASPALDYCEDNGITDTREMLAICLCGADGLLDGSYQKAMDATSKPTE